MVTTAAANNKTLSRLERIQTRPGLQKSMKNNKQNEKKGCFLNRTATPQLQYFLNGSSELLKKTHDSLEDHVTKPGMCSLPCRGVPDQAVALPGGAARHRQVRERLVPDLLRGRVETGALCCPLEAALIVCEPWPDCLPLLAFPSFANPR